MSEKKLRKSCMNMYIYIFKYIDIIKLTDEREEI